MNSVNPEISPYNEPALPAIYNDLPELTTARLVLRKMRLTDAGDMFAYASDTDVSRHLVWTPHQNIDETLGFLKYVLSPFVRVSDGFLTVLPLCWGSGMKYLLRPRLLCS